MKSTRKIEASDRDPAIYTFQEMVHEEGVFIDCEDSYSDLFISFGAGSGSCLTVLRSPGEASAVEIVDEALWGECRFVKFSGEVNLTFKN